MEYTIERRKTHDLFISLRFGYISRYKYVLLYGILCRWLYAWDEKMTLIDAIRFLLAVRNNTATHYDSVDVNRAYTALAEFLLVIGHIDSQR